MDGFINGILGGIVPASGVVVVYIFALSGRLAKLETDINWIKRFIDKCLPS